MINNIRRIIIVAGARPNFMKIAPLMHEFRRHMKTCETLLVHTGQHYDFEMSEVFFQNLRIPTPDIYLKIGSASHTVQTARIMMSFENVINNIKPDIVVVVGDVNSTLACSLVASKSGIRIAHVEAGLRSFDRGMPEEINRVITDSLSDLLFVSEACGIRNLKKEGVNSDKIHFVGNVMIDTLLANLKTVNRSNILKELNLNSKAYCAMTLHRPSNVDSKEALAEIFDILESIPQNIQIVCPMHPRTKKMMKTHGVLKKFEGLSNFLMIEPLGYIEFIKLVKESKFILTDSGGIQEETTVLKVPCLTMRENTERPVTITKGTNYLVGRNRKRIIGVVDNIINGKAKKGSIPKFWDGRVAERIVEIINSQK